MFATIGAVVFGTGLWLFLLRRYDRVEPESLKSLLGVAVIGGGASLVAAALFNEGFAGLLGVRPDFTTRAGDVPLWRIAAFCLFVGFNEECCKAIAAVFATRRLGNLDEPVDAMIYAMTVALGFAAAENVIYARNYGNEVLLVRFLWPVPAHMAYAAVWGYGLARARFGASERTRARVFAPYVLAAGLLHAAANFLLIMESTYAALASLSGLVGLAYFAHHRLLQLVAESPFLEPGECPNCRNLNPPHAAKCVYCSTPIGGTELFRTCPCGKARVPARLNACPECGNVM